MRNELKIEIETENGQIVWKHYRFPSWKLTGKWSEDFIASLTHALKTGSAIEPVGIQGTEPQGTQDTNPVMEEEAALVLSGLGVNRKDIKRLIQKAGPCKDAEELVLKCIRR